jgi:CRISPR-associated exonuclease Cas4
VISKRELYQYGFCPEKHNLCYVKQISVLPTKEMILGRLLHYTRELVEKEEYAIVKSIGRDFSFDNILDKYKKRKEILFKAAVKKSHVIHRLSEEDLTCAQKDLDLLLHEKAVRTTRILQWCHCEKRELAVIVSPPWKYINVELTSKKLNLKGHADRIEHCGPFFYPVEIKTGTPPVYVFSQDRLEIGCTALLMEDYFKIPVVVGYVEYTRIGERRPVPIDEKLRKDVVTVRDSIAKRTYPQKEYTKKCGVCEYNRVCWNDSDN